MARNLLALGATPPGLYVDEASVGYNAWTIAHHGVDEHGVHWPLFFEAFGEYKNPLYIYALAPLLRVAPLSAEVVRLPAAIFGLLTVVFLSMAAWRLSRSRWIALLVFALAALTPWLTQESRLGFEVSAMTVLLAAALWCLAGDATPARLGAAGVLLGLAVYGYTSARLEVLLFAVAFVIAYGARRRRLPGWWLVLVPIAVTYAGLAVYNLRNPGALTARFDVISIAADGAPLLTLINRFITNYFSYFGPVFLFVTGDLNPRHHTGYGGMLPWIALPLLIAGLLALWRRREQPFARFLLLSLVLSPCAAAITGESVPHSLRAADMLPMLVLVEAYGIVGARDLWPRRGALMGIAAAAALAVQGGLYTLDMYTAYPARAATAFDTGVEPAILRASQALSAGGTVYLSSRLEQPYIEAFFALRPDPPAQPVDDDVTPGLATLGMRIADPVFAEATAQPGDLLVLGASDPMPRHGQVIDTEYAPRNPLDASGGGEPLAYVVRVR